ncbi:MAG TPA: acetyltransferase [Pyrinomonadaceae bacterium]|nr:acetyltransferase [Pyrinomonadaceae bacterium]
MKRIVIIGAGGHGREVSDILRAQTATEIVGFIDDCKEIHGNEVDGLPVLGDWSWFDSVRPAEFAVVCAVGSPQLCRRLIQRAKSLGLGFASAISQLAYVSPLARLGEGITVFPFAVINPGAVVESFSILNLACTVSHDTKIGRYSNVNPGAHLAGNVTLGEGCYVGMGANVIQGRSIGEWSIVGAGAVVTANLPANVTAVGVPAKIVKTREDRWYDK